MGQMELMQKIKSKNLENRVQRPGFFQSKQIACEAVHEAIQLTEGVTAIGSNIFWVTNSNAYDEDHTHLLEKEIFPKAFKENKKWAERIVETLEKSAEESKVFIDALSITDWSNKNYKEKIQTIKEYVDLLINIQKYYVIAVPLTNYCERVLKEKGGSLLEYAVQYKALDMDGINNSLVKIKNAEGHEKNKLIEEHIKEFAWIKTGYNIVSEYTKEDVLGELDSDIHIFEPRKIPESKYGYIATALQIGIYLRNRMKELSQQIWFAYDGLAAQLATDFNISKKDFLQLHYNEAIESLKQGKLSISRETIEERHCGYIVGFIDDKEVIATGGVVEEASEYLNAVNIEGVTEIKGDVASKGFVTGTARIIANLSEIEKLHEKDILVTSMTTPDFVVAMKKAGAIVTDEGGLSCHAAIVSRELGKPCVIGTKIATKVIQDGAEIEVDANTGVVKIL
jgi:phosphoenolpyruvate synthase/pyruvate phosphate dikinase